jgi:hypothetical protein
VRIFNVLRSAVDRETGGFPAWRRTPAQMPIAASRV